MVGLFFLPYGLNHPLKEDWTGSNQFIVADMTGEAKLDIVTCSEKIDLTVRCWENEGRPATSTPK